MGEINPTDGEEIFQNIRTETLKTDYIANVRNPDIIRGLQLPNPKVFVEDIY